MQGPPMASPFSSPPIKKQRASGTPAAMQKPFQDPSLAVSQKRAQLLKLAQSNSNNNANQPSATSLMNQARSSLMVGVGGPPMSLLSSGPPIIPTSKLAEPSVVSRRTTVMNGGSNGHYHYGPNNSNGTDTMSRQPGSGLRGGGRPSGGGGGPPTLFAATVPPSPKPAEFYNTNPASPRSPTAAAIAAVAVKSLESTTSTAPPSNKKYNDDDQLVRRLEFAKAAMTTTATTSNNTNNNDNNTPTPLRSKSAPPSRKPQPPPPPPRVKEEPAANSKTVSFQPAPEETAPLPETPELTKAGGGGSPVTPSNTIHAGFTPMPPKHAGSTPFPRAATSTTPNTKARQAMLRDLQDIADTPKSNTNTTTTPEASPELRLQQQLTGATKEKAEALKKVSLLEGQLAHLKKEAASSNNNSVKFLSPILGSKPDPPKKRYPKSPLPKRLSERFDGQPSATNDDQDVLRAAAASIPYEFTLDDRTFTVRRPYGLAEEKDLWYKIGQLNAKEYARKTNVEDETSLEVATTCDDGSIFSLYGSHFVRHLTLDEGPKEYEDESSTTLLGNVLYVDDNGVDQQYSLDDIWGTAMEVRGLYRTSLRAAADALLHAKSTSFAPYKESAANGSSSSKATVDAGMTTDPMPKPKVAPPPPPVVEDDSDPLGSALRMCFSWIFWIVFVCIKTVFQCCITTMYVSIAGVVFSLVYLHLRDDNGANEMGAITNVYTNRGGVV